MKTLLTFPKSRFRPPLVQFLVPNVVLLVVYLLAAHLSLQLSIAQGNVSPVWLPTGLAMAALLWWGWRLWSAVALGALLITWNTGAGVALGNTLQAVVGA